MKRKTLYIVEHVGKGRKSLVNREFKTINAVAKALKVGERVTCGWYQISPDQPKDSMFSLKNKIGYREFEQRKDGIAYSQFPQYEYFL